MKPNAADAQNSVMFLLYFEMDARRAIEEEGSYLVVMTARRYEAQRGRRSKDSKNRVP